MTKKDQERKKHMKKKEDDLKRNIKDDPKNPLTIQALA